MLGAEAEAAAAAGVAAANSRTHSDNNKTSSNNPRDRANVVLAFPVTVADGAEEALVVAGTKTPRMPTLLKVDKRTGVI